MSCILKESYISLCVEMVLSRGIIAAGGIVVGYMCAGGGMTLVEKYGAFKVAGCLVGTALTVYAVAQVPLSVTAERTCTGSLRYGIFTWMLPKRERDITNNMD